VGEETNLYNSIDLCVGAGLTAKQARVNLTKYRVLFFRVVRVVFVLFVFNGFCF